MCERSRRWLGTFILILYSAQLSGRCRLGGREGSLWACLLEMEQHAKYIPRGETSLRLHEQNKVLELPNWIKLKEGKDEHLKTACFPPHNPKGGELNMGTLNLGLLGRPCSVETANQNAENELYTKEEKQSLLFAGWWKYETCWNC